MMPTSCITVVFLGGKDELISLAVLDRFKAKLSQTPRQTRKPATLPLSYGLPIIPIPGQKSSGPRDR
jgi:hypothetical protein